jgi:arabinose-5-phosphate isomerase
MDYTKHGQKIIRMEAGSVAAMADRLDSSFARAVEEILACKGRVIISGMGKSGLVGRKITATLNSTGVSSFFLHPAEAMHGDLGLMQKGDILLLISKSGQLEEMDTIISAARRLGIQIIFFGGTPGSSLFERADIALDCSVEEEACPNNLVPTSSSTAALVMGDALALTLLEARSFTPEDFASLHPGGLLGRRLLKRVSELHHSGKELPLVPLDATVSEMVIEMTGKRLGCVVLKDAEGKTTGVFTDGDLRRLISKRKEVFHLKASEVMIAAPKTISQDALLDAALAVMEEHSITQLPTVDQNDNLVGIIHLHDILKSKLV